MVGRAVGIEAKILEETHLDEILSEFVSGFLA
jgi:hypothetical protein